MNNNFGVNNTSNTGSQISSSSGPQKEGVLSVDLGGSEPLTLSPADKPPTTDASAKFAPTHNAQTRKTLEDRAQQKKLTHRPLARSNILDAEEIERNQKANEEKLKEKVKKTALPQRVNKYQEQERVQQYQRFEEAIKKAFKERKFQTIQELIDFTYNPKNQAFYDDVTDAYEALRLLQQNSFEADPSDPNYDPDFNSLAESCNQAAQSLWTDFGPEIRAGFNIFAAKNEIDAYRLLVLKFDNPLSTFKSVLEYDDSKIDSPTNKPQNPTPLLNSTLPSTIKLKPRLEKFKKTIDFLISSIQSDLRAAESSREPEFLHNVWNQLDRIRGCDYIVLQCDNLIQYLHSNAV